MSETFQFNLPLLQAAQAQKHVTVNEALTRLDAVAQLRLVSDAETVPPLSALEGTAYSVPNGAVNAWDGHIGEIAVFVNGGWVFMTPKTGWKAWIESISDSAVFDGNIWQPRVVAMTASGASTAFHMIEFDHVITPGATNTTTVNIEGSMLVFGVTGRIKQAISGTGLTGWKMGVSGMENRYGDPHSTAQGAWIRALTGTPVVYYGAEPLVLSALGGDFISGEIKLVIHGLLFQYPANI